MSKLRVASFSISVDGYAAGPNQDIDNPLGNGGTALHEWAFPTRTFQKKVFGAAGGTTGVDDDYAARSFDNVGAWIMGRNMFGPFRGPWLNETWKGWWGENPPYHTPVFVLSHYPRASIEMQGGTTCTLRLHPLCSDRGSTFLAISTSRSSAIAVASTWEHQKRHTW